MTTKIKPDSLFPETLSRTLLGLYEPDGVEATLSALLFRCLVAGRGVLSKHSGCEADPTAPGDRRGTCGGRGRAASASAELGVSGPLAGIRREQRPSLCFLASRPASSPLVLRSAVQ